MRPLMGQRSAAPAPRDPAPSRWAYRFQRIWLTPVFRSLLRTGVPSFLIALFAGWYLTDEATQDAIHLAFNDMRRSISERPEFLLQRMEIAGASEDLAVDVREVVQLDFPTSSFDIDLDHVRERISGLDAVARVDLRVVSGGVLAVLIAERVPAVVWRAEGVLELLDEGGRRVAPLGSRAERPDLPLLAGIGADTAVPEALALVAAARPIADRLRGLVRVGERRWDVVLDRNQRIMLPEREPVTALEAVIALDQSRELLARDVAAVDLRNPGRPTARLAPLAVKELQRIRAIVEEGGR